MRKIITTCIIAAFAMLQASESQKALANPQDTKRPLTERMAEVRVETKEKLNGEMSVLPSNEDQVCEVPHTEAEDQELVERAIEVCYPQMKKIPDQYYINATQLLQVEYALRVPDSMRGMTLAAACVESGFNEKAEGDHRFSKDGKTPKAIGILQMWPVYEHAYKVNRRDVVSSAKGWLTHIERQVPSVRKNCKTKTEVDTWRLAWVHGVRAPKAGGRCHENVNHWYVFLKIKSKLTGNHT